MQAEWKGKNLKESIWFYPSTYVCTFTESCEKIHKHIIWVGSEPTTILEQISCHQITEITLSGYHNNLCQICIGDKEDGFLKFI